MSLIDAFLLDPHPFNVRIAGRGDDAQYYQEQHVRRALREVES